MSSALQHRSVLSQPAARRGLGAVLAVDVGGTFTDAVLVAGDRVYSAKAPSTDPQHQGALAAALAVLALAGVLPSGVTRFVHGMTVATNALLEGKGARVAAVTTAGFRDLLEIGRQVRTGLYSLAPSRPAPLVPRERCFTLAERCGAEGPVAVPAPADLDETVRAVVAARPEAVAVCLLWSFAHPAHEQTLAAALEKALPGIPVVTSSALCPLFREYERLNTVVVDAYVTPCTRTYLEALARSCREAGLPAPEIMQSSAGTAPLGRGARHGAHLLLSGPAGGALGARLLADRLGHRRVVSFDMGGTSTDCAALDEGQAGLLATSTERVVAGSVVRLPLVDIVTVSAGGGSIAWADEGGALRVGPASAGARPGPACYGLGGADATVTDAHLLLGRIPSGVAFAGHLRLERAPAEEAVAALGSRLGMGPAEAAAGIVRVAGAAMAAALRRVTVERGLDPRAHSLVAFGGAGPLHACELAEELGMTSVIVPLQAGVLSAAGLAVAPERADAAATVGWRSDRGQPADWDRAWDRVEAEARRRLGRGEGGRVRHEVETRYVGQSHELLVTTDRAAGPAALVAAFHRLHEQRYGYRAEDTPVEVVTVRVVAFVPAEAGLPDLPVPRLNAAGNTPVVVEGNLVPCPLLRLEQGGGLGAGGGGGPAPGPGVPADGPAVLTAPEFTAYLAPGWRMAPVPGALLFTRVREDQVGAPTTEEAQAGAAPSATEAGAAPSATRPADSPTGAEAAAAPAPRGRGTVHFGPVELELAVGSFQSLAEEMGASLVRSARSANIKERRDSSTALFDAAGRLVVQAEHIPVHLGALPASVAAVAERPQRAGDVWVLNHPYQGGTHLPDVTMVAPLIVAGRLVALAANRAHHADMGGAVPGSMPAGARSLFAEGLIIPPVRLVAEGVEQEDVLALLLANCRRPEERLGDLRAQAASLRLGLRRLAELDATRGPGYGAAAMTAVRDYSRTRSLRALADLPAGVYRGEDALEGDGTTSADIPLRVEVTISPEGLRFDFRDSASEVEGNLNCPRAVTVSACLFVARCLLDPSPFGAAGCAELVEVVTRPGSIVDARPPRAVAGGNVETSQRIVDTILDALGEPLGLAAESQGTMNNLTLGSSDFSYYETLGGGGGASRDGPGASGIHSGMTNTLNTPVEALERDFPLQVLRYELREGSGGAGRHRGGEGLVRSLRVLGPATLSLLSERRRRGPRGRGGGGPGLPGRNLLNGEELPGKTQRELAPGDVVTVETPGGGGWGPRL